VRQGEGETAQVLFDASGKANGRGAYVCASADCIGKAIKQKRFERSLKVPATPPGLEGELLARVSPENVEGQASIEKTPRAG
jgi:predicted RNA-binding protein YlxR (DUF448 family)